MTKTSSTGTRPEDERIANVLAQVEAIAEELQDEAAETETHSRLTDRAVELLLGTDVTKVFLPEMLGGLGLYPGQALPVLERVAYIDGSIGWVNTIFAAGGHMVAYMTEENARNLIDEVKTPFFGAVSNGSATAEQVDGGWKVNGAFRYASGSKHASHVFVPVRKVVDGTPVEGPAGDGMMLVARSQIGFGEGWDTLGLRGTGSVDLTFVDAFVPAHQELPPIWQPPALAGNQGAGGMLLMILLMHVGFATGISQRILDEMKDFANRPAGRPGAQPLAARERYRIEYAQHYLAAQAGRALLSATLAEIDDTLRAGDKPSRRQISMVMGSSIHMHDVARDLAAWAFRRGGGATLRAGVLQRAIRDAMSGTQHFIVDDSHLDDIGFDLLGAPENYAWLGLQLGPIPGTETAG